MACGQSITGFFDSFLTSIEQFGLEQGDLAERLGAWLERSHFNCPIAPNFSSNENWLITSN
jgi:hypothetical protein